jgi:hypothetical protein
MSHICYRVLRQQNYWTEFSHMAAPKISTIDFNLNEKVVIC